MNEVEKILLANKSWAQEKKIFDPDFFKRLENVQSPKKDEINKVKEEVV